MPPAPRLDEALGVGRRGHRAHAKTQVPTRPEELLLSHESSSSTLRPPPDNSESKNPGRGKVLRTYKWSQFHGKEEVTDFDEAHFSADGIFSQTSSEGHKEYQDRLRAAHLRKEGMGKAEIAKALGRSERFVSKWWQKEKQEVPLPWGVHAYLTKDMGKNSNGVGAVNGAAMTEESVNDTATWWRDVEVRRGYGANPAIYDEILMNTDWKPTNSRTRDFATGAFHLRYDKQGNMKWEGHQNGKYKAGLSPGMDKVLQKLNSEYGIEDSTSGIITNWYPDGKGYLGSHRHDCWTALFSFGHERILTIDNTPVLMQDGDLCIFGTQRHGVPLMPEITEGRITFVVFFYPDRTQKKAMWQTITDAETSEAAEKKEADAKAKAASAQAPKPPENSREILSLQQLGFARVDAEMALRASQNDVERAAELLLMAGAGAPPEPAAVLGEAATLSLCDAGSQPSAPSKGGRFRKGKAAPEIATASSSSSSSTAVPSSSGASSSNEGGDEALARRLQMEEEGNAAAMSDAEVAALALQLDELEKQRQEDPTMLAAQFQEYEAMIDREDAERWNGHGDLMHSPFSRMHLNIDAMDKVTLYSVGHGDMLEKDFWEMLQCNSIRVLYDVRPTDHRGEMHSRHHRYSVASMRQQCRSRGVIFKSMPLGRESAYGMLAHIKSDEGRHTLIELVWQAKRKRTAFMGSEELWQHDARQVAAELLTQAGHTVEHVRSDGSTERHKSGIVYPDFLTREEERLKLLEKKRQAGELAKPEKSRVSRSSEVVASRLATPAEEVDAMAEMRNAANQKELVVAQRKLARYQRIAEEKGLLAKKVLTNTPEWILQEAREQAEWVKAKKQEKEEKSAAVHGAVSPPPIPEGDEELASPELLSVLEDAGIVDEVAVAIAASDDAAPNREAEVGILEEEAAPPSEPHQEVSAPRRTWRGRRHAVND